MKFEEQFPDLKDKVVKDDGYGNGVNVPSGFISYIMIEDVQKYCIDKQKGIDIIKKKLKFLNHVLKQGISESDKLVNQLGVNVAIKILKELKKEFRK